MVDHEALVGMLGRLRLTVARDQLDSLLDEAARREMTLREALAFLCEREVARHDERPVKMALRIARFPVARDLHTFGFAAQPSLAGTVTRVPGGRVAFSWSIRRTDAACGDRASGAGGFPTRTAAATDGASILRMVFGLMPVSRAICSPG